MRFACSVPSQGKALVLSRSRKPKVGRAASKRRSLRVQATCSEFLLANHPDANIRELCRRFGISPQTGYKWLNRYRKKGAAGLVERSRKPRSSPMQTDKSLRKRWSPSARSTPPVAVARSGICWTSAFVPVPSPMCCIVTG